MQNCIKSILFLLMVSKETVYGAFVDYFGDIKLSLIKNENGWSIYGARVHSNLNETRYIFAITHGFRQNEVTLNNLDWVSLQTRTSDENHNVPTHTLYLTPQRKELLNDKLTVVNRTNEQTEYITNLPIKVRLLHDPKKKNYLQYPDTTLMYNAIETYRCIIELL